jgi:riboflavin synthase
MFTGIVRELGTIARLERSQGVVRLTIDGPKTASQLERLDSLAVNGVCLSVVDIRQRLITCEVIHESLALTTLGGLKRGQRVNLEPSLAVSDRLNGHLVFGHVDGVGTIVKRRTVTGEQVLEIRVAPQLRSLLVPKGPVAVDGISLTV